MTTRTIQTTLPVQRVGNQHALQKIAVVFFALSTIVINVLANVVPYNNQTTGEISDRFQVLFVPAGYVFSIWGVIYLGMLAYAVFQARRTDEAEGLWSKIAWWFILSCIANSTWIFLWHWNQLGWSVAMILVLLVSLLAIYGQMSKRGWEVGNLTQSEKWSVYIPFSIYLAWSCVATVANISTWLWEMQWSGFGINESVWGLIMLIVAAGLGIFFGAVRRNFAYAAVIVWAFVGIGVKQASIPMIAYSAYGLAMIVLLLAIWGQLKRVASPERAS